MPLGRKQIVRKDINLAGKQVRDRGSAAPIWHLQHLHVRKMLNHCHGEMADLPLALRGIIDLAWICPCVSNKIDEAVGRQTGLADQYGGVARNDADRFECAGVELLVWEQKVVRH